LTRSKKRIREIWWRCGDCFVAEFFVCDNCWVLRLLRGRERWWRCDSEFMLLLSRVSRAI